MNYNKKFLKQIIEQKNRIVHARITKLTFDELPIEVITGKITAGSINLDGDSALRRTCSLTLVSDDVRDCDYDWAFNTKFKLEIGLDNFIDSNKPNIIWFE
jgi:hypothetical protein